MDIIIRKLVEIQILGFDWEIDQRHGQITFRVMKQNNEGTEIVQHTSTVFCKYASNNSVELGKSDLLKQIGLIKK